MSVNESWLNVGRRIRHIRKANRLTLRQLALGCDLSPNAISLVERGEVAPSVATLCKIAHALGVSASSLFQEVCQPQIVLRRAGGIGEDALVERTLGAFACSLPSAGPDRRLQSPKLRDDLLAPQEGATRQSVMCLCGQVTLEVDEQSYSLSPGDALTFNSEILHRWHNPGSSTGVAVLVIPPDSMKGE